MIKTEFISNIDDFEDVVHRYKVNGFEVMAIDFYPNGAKVAFTHMKIDTTDLERGLKL